MIFKGPHLRLPERCLLCGSTCCDTHQALCTPCLADLPQLKAGCSHCLAPLTGHIPSQKILCGRCIKSPPAFDQVISSYPYARPISDFILRGKFNQDLASLKLIGELMATSLSANNHLPPSLLTPVPLHPSRYRERGFNQSAEIARTLAKLLNAPLEKHLIKRNIHSVPQMSLPAKARQKNIRGIFSVNRHINGEHITVIDDVMTSGATANEIARVLKKAGASRVDIWTFARA